eukprot:TRINITY_DN29083_c0_g1_i1.p1 TRINITY_DN29083_c0_g1~~TRINITY_DN29083_c0_g1_i1.p1  ORF type:complete len:867 (+),score=148.17 TRINITY_DN29083_c0_g1_i1:87-2687(+)
MFADAPLPFPQGVPLSAGDASYPVGFPQCAPPTRAPRAARSVLRSRPSTERAMEDDRRLSADCTRRPSFVPATPPAPLVLAPPCRTASMDSNLMAMAVGSAPGGSMPFALMTKANSFATVADYSSGQQFLRSHDIPGTQASSASEGPRPIVRSLSACSSRLGVGVLGNPAAWMPQGGLQPHVVPNAVPQGGSFVSAAPQAAIYLPQTPAGSYVPPPQTPNSYVPPPTVNAQPSRLSTPRHSMAQVVQQPGSYVPPPVHEHTGNSYVPVPLPQTPLGSYVPPPQPNYVPLPSTPAAHRIQPTGSYVPAASAPAQPGSFIPAPMHLQPTPPMHGASTPAQPPPAAVFPGTATPMQRTQSPRRNSRPRAPRPEMMVKTGEPLGAQLECVVGGYHIRCSEALGRGSFSTVWAGETLVAPGGQVGEQVAVKDIGCASEAELRQAVWEARLLERLRSPDLRIPTFLGHQVEPHPNGKASDRSRWHVRLAMSKAPGEPIDAYLRRPVPPSTSSQEAPQAVRRGCALARAFLRQLGPTVDRVSHFAWHRDINSRNILISDKIDGGTLKYHFDADETANRASFMLIDFGLAVDSSTWPQRWPTADVAGDCRYWGASSFLMSFYGPSETASRKDFCKQYQTKLDIVGLGLTALELLCATVLATAQSWGKDGLRGSWRRLFLHWEKYRSEVSRWHQKIFKIFTSGGDANELYRQLAQERVVERIVDHHRNMQAMLRACVHRAEDQRIQRLLGVLAEMLDEKSNMTLADAVHAIGGPDPLPVRGPAPVVPAAAGMQPLTRSSSASRIVRQASHGPMPMVAGFATPSRPAPMSQVPVPHFQLAAAPMQTMPISASDKFAHEQKQAAYNRVGRPAAFAGA